MRYFFTLITLLFITASVRAADYPTNTITMVVPFSAGGASDNVARPLAQAMSKISGQRVIVLNKPGASSQIGISYVAEAKPDGYTILLALPNILSNPFANRLTGKDTPYRVDQFAPIARVTSDPTILAVRADSKWKSIQDLITDAKANPGKYSYGSAGLYSPAHISALLFLHAAGLDILHIPYNGGGELTVATLGGQVDMGFNTNATLSQHFRANKLRPLVVQSDERLANIPDTPSTKDLGYDASYAYWAGIFAPAGTPQDIQEKLRELVAAAVKHPDFVNPMTTAGANISYLNAPEFQAFLTKDSKRQEEVLNASAKTQPAPGK